MIVAERNGAHLSHRIHTRETRQTLRQLLLEESRAFTAVSLVSQVARNTHDTTHLKAGIDGLRHVQTPQQ